MALAVIYCRCSTEEESQVDALKNQVMEARTCVKENGWTMVDEYVESKSGTTSRGRQQYSRLLDDMLTSKFDIIVIKSQDRLMRNTKDWYLFVDRLSTQGKKLYLYLERKFYSPDDALLTGIKAILAEEYSRELSKKVANAHRHRQMSGGRVMLTNRAYGFLKAADGSVRIDEKEAEVIRRIYKLCAAGYGSRTIANVLEKEGIVSTAGKIMNASTIRRMIRNPLYKGTFVMNKKHFDFSTKRTIKNPESEWIYDDSLVPAIVEEELWEQANRAISMRAEKGRQNEEYVRENVKGSNPGKYSLSGKLICGVCGRPYYRSWRRKKSEPGKTIYEWKCSGYINYGRNGKKRRDSRRKALFPDGERGCDNSHLNEEIVFGMLKQCSSMYFQMKREEKDGIIETTIRLLGQVLVQSPREIRMETLEKEVLELERKKKLLLDKLLDGIVSDEDYGKRNKDLEEKLEKTLEEQEQCRIPSVQQKNMENRLMEIKERLEHGGLERAAAERLLADIDKIVVHEWQLEFRFHPFHMPGIPVGESGETGQAVKEDEKMVSLFLNYPFPSDTEKGRFLDRQKLMEWIKEYPSFTVKQYAEKMGRSPYMVQNRMNELRKAGYIEFRKSGRDGRWVIIKKLPGGGVDE